MPRRHYTRPQANAKPNPKNPLNKLYKGLTRLFSGPIVQFRREWARSEHQSDLARYDFENPYGQVFAKNKYDPFEYMYSRRIAEASRIDRYMDYDQMEYEPIIARALNMYAHEITATNGFDPVLHIQSDNVAIKGVLEDLFYNVINIEMNLFGWVREMVKYGDFMLYMDVQDGKGIQNLLGLHTPEVEMLRGEDETNPNYVQYQWNNANFTFENWQIAHFRIKGNQRYEPYGVSVLDPARVIFRSAQLMETHMMSYRVIRSTERRVFYIDVGGIAPQDIEQHIQKMATQFKRQSISDPDTGRVDLRYNPASVEEDFFIPVRGDSQNKIEMLDGGKFTGEIEDIKHIMEKLYTALNIPQTYLSRGEGSDDSGSNLAQKDITFANIIMNLQRYVVSELNKMAIVHLYALGFRGQDLINFELSLNNPSRLAEMQELEALQQRLEVATSAWESGFYSRREVAIDILKKTAKEFERSQLERFYDAKYDARIEAMAQMAESGMGGAFGGDLGELPGQDDIAAMEGEGDMLAEPGDVGDSVTGEGVGSEDIFDVSDIGDIDYARENEDEDDIETGDMLAAPGRRDDSYTPVTSDRRKAGARKRSWASKRGKTKLGRRKRERADARSKGQLKKYSMGIHEGYVDNLRSIADKYDREKKNGRDLMAPSKLLVERAGLDLDDEDWEEE